MKKEEIEKKVEKEVYEILKSQAIYEDMLGYKNVFNDLKKEILKKQYNIVYDDKVEMGYHND